MENVDTGIYKDTLLKDLFRNPTIVKAIDPQSSSYIPDEPDSIIYSNLFPYLHIPDAQTKGDVYILVEADVLSIERSNPTFVDMRVFIRVMAHQSRMRYGGQKGTRIDYIAKEIIHMLDGSLKYGYGQLKVLSSIGNILSENINYHYRDLAFKTVDITASAGRKVGSFK